MNYFHTPLTSLHQAGEEMGPQKCCNWSYVKCTHTIYHSPRGMREYSHHDCPCHRRTRRTYVNHDNNRRLQARRILGPSPVNTLALSSEDLEDTDLRALFFVLFDRRPKDPIKALSLESSEFATEGLNLVSQYLDTNQILESLSLSDVSFVESSIFDFLLTQLITPPNYRL